MQFTVKLVNLFDSREVWTGIQYKDRLSREDHHQWHGVEITIIKERLACVRAYLNDDALIF